ncbi:MAG: RsmD family RNA methyltransferase [Actinomycetota bacterium]
MRVIAGSARGRRLRGPDGRATRPITDRAKEGIFNMLGSLGGVDGMVVADLWAGSGSFGIEALSRGAERAIFVERGREALACLRDNLATLGFDDRATVVPGSVLTAAPTLDHVDLAFCDPPYADDPWTELFGVVRADLVVGHAERPVPLPVGWDELRRRDYGRARIVIAERAPS